ncbi:hypothetical protein EXN66_Car016219 [Channa argus]|uniref:Uncharacterized protein n=1 Tax=Channa argus TaxID=215402 RepID=A0A6G1QDA1_CHAAH|nr:hypothetical protein EXN66_Car016219 [Channa argus]KAK2894172.1 hypothetical protein Q8A73_016656 [Channa argus]
MALNGCAIFCKCTLIFLNVIFAVVGFAFLFLSVLLRSSISKIGSFETDYAAFVGVAVLIVLSLVVQIVVTFGCYGACSENKCALQVFSVLVAVLAITEGLVGFSVYSNCYEICLQVLSIFYTESSVVIGLFLATEALLITALICSIVLSCNIDSSVPSPQYIALTYSTPVLDNIQKSPHEFSTSSYPHPEKAPVVFPSLTVANIPGIPAKCP